MAIFGSDRHVQTSADDIEQDYDVVLVAIRRSAITPNVTYKPSQEKSQLL
jgi:hypothetical protein